MSRPQKRLESVEVEKTDDNKNNHIIYLNFTENYTISLKLEKDSKEEEIAKKLRNLYESIEVSL